MVETERSAEIAYVITEDALSPASTVLEDHDQQLAAASAIHLCRCVPRDARPVDLPPPPTTAYGIPVAETWAPTGDWLITHAEELTEDCASRLVVRLAWPFGAEAETALLLVKLSHPALRLAVTLPAQNGLEAFAYLNRLSMSWMALPPGGVVDEDWAALLRSLSRKWCFDPGAVTTVEPVASGFGWGLSSRLTPERAVWMGRMVRAETSCASFDWSPTLHGVLIAASMEPMGSPFTEFARVDRLWLDELFDFCEVFDIERLAKLAQGPAAIGGTEAYDER